MIGFILFPLLFPARNLDLSDKLGVATSNPDLLPNTIESVLGQNFENYEIIVVDNACLDSTKKLVESFKSIKAQIRYICEPDIGLHNARHAGARASNGNILLYIDDDIICDKNLLREILKFYADTNVGCVGGKILPKWEVYPPSWLTQFPKWYLSILDDEDGPKEVQWIYGCNFSIRKELLFELGGFNPDAFGDKNMWCMRGDGEIGLLRKVHNVGKKVIYNPNAIVWHFIPKSRLTVEYFKERAFKSGIEASFSKYRYNDDSFHSLNLLFRAGAFGIYYTLHSLLALIPNKNSIKHKVTSSYYKGRCLYELNLSRDMKLLEFVKEESWWK